MAPDPPGFVAPAHLWVPPGALTDAGDEAAELAESLGLVLDDEQRLALQCLLAERSPGSWAALEACIVAARQNLKTFVLILAVLYDLFIRDVRLAVWTAHRFKTTQEAFTDLNAIITGSDFLRKQVKKVSTGNGEEGFELRSGARLDFLARSSGGGRGMSGDVVILDEALYLTPKMMGALLPTLSARPNPQVRYGSSSGLPESDVLRAIRDRGRPGGDPSLVYLEWSAPPGGCTADDCDHHLGVAGCALDDIEKIRLANPALGRRISVDYVMSERRALAAQPEEFARERLGWWSDPDAATAGIPADAWRDCTATAAELAGGPSIALDVALDRTRTSIGVAVARTDTRIQLELPEHLAGTKAAVDRCVEMHRSWGVPVHLAATGPAAALIPDLEARGVPVVQIPGPDVAKACGAMLDAVTARTVAHLGDPVLTAAVNAARTKTGESFVFTRRGGADISPLYAVTLARWAATTSPDYDLLDSVY